MSNDALNYSSEDCIIVALTSSTKRPYTLEITEEDIREGILHDKSFVRYDKPGTVQQELVKLRIARVSKAFFAKVKEKIIGAM